jgi:hypothetical protein
MFLKYHKDAITGKKWKIKDDTKTVDCKKIYEEMREMSFQFSWMQGRPWRQCISEKKKDGKTHYAEKLNTVHYSLHANFFRPLSPCK